MSDFDEEALPCYYCGEPADTVDHVVPQSMLDAARDSGEEVLIAALQDRRRRMTVACCQECNNLAGAKYHASLIERSEYVRTRLGHRHRKVLTMPDWSATELMELSEQLRNLVLARLIERDLVRRRLRYRAAGVLPIQAELRALAEAVSNQASPPEQLALAVSVI